MIHYHGMPLSGPTTGMAPFLSGRHAFVSHAHPRSAEIAFASARSVALDNGAFSAWKRGKAPDWPAYYDWVERWRPHPGFDWAVIPDVIDGTAADNDRLLERWPHRAHEGVPVWHLHEDIRRLVYLAAAWPRVAFGSSGEYAKIGTPQWKERMADAMDAVCGILADGKPICKLHGLRMLDRRLVAQYPFASADSTNAARNCAIDKRWKVYAPKKRWQRATVIAQMVEEQMSPPTWVRPPPHVMAKGKIIVEKPEFLPLFS